MRILVVSQHFWPEAFRLNSFVNDLRAANFDVEVLTGQPNYPAGEVFDGYRWWAAFTHRHEGLYIHRVPLFPRGQGKAWRLALNYASFIVSGILIGTWLLRRRKFDVIFVYATSPLLQALVAIWLKKIKRAPVVIWVQDLWPHSLSATGYVSSPRILALVGKLVAFIYRRADLLLIQSPAFEPAVRSYAGDTPISYFPNPGDAHLADRASPPRRTETDGESFNFMFAGNLGTVQALGTIVGAASLLNHRENIRILMVGSGVRSEWLAAEVCRLGLTNIEILGRFPPEEMPKLFERASALLLTLVKDPIVSLTVPSKVQSYLATGLPILAAIDGAGGRVVSEARAGLSCPAEDAEALASAMIAMRRKTSDERRQMGEAGIAYYRKHFDPAVLTLEIRQHFAAIVGRGEGVRLR